MYQLYYYPDNASLAPHLILTHIGCDFELILVDRTQGAHKQADYLKLNPTGRIPALIRHGQPMFEAAAICLQLAYDHPEAKLWPDAQDSNHPQALQWLMYLTNTLQTEELLYFYPSRHVTSDEAAAQLKATQEARIGDMLQLLDDTLATQPYLCGHQLTLCDYYLLMLANWTYGFDKPADQYPHLRPYLKKLLQTDTVKQVFAKEEIRWSIED